jgi:hypothetical protein
MPEEYAKWFGRGFYLAFGATAGVVFALWAMAQLGLVVSMVNQ